MVCSSPASPRGVSASPPRRGRGATDDDDDSDDGSAGDRRGARRGSGVVSPKALPLAGDGVVVAASDNGRDRGGRGGDTGGVTAPDPPTKPAPAPAARRPAGRDVHGGAAAPKPAQLDRLREECRALADALELKRSEVDARADALDAAAAAVAAAGLGAGVAVAAFGSHASGMETHASDVDVEVTGVVVPADDGSLADADRAAALKALDSIAAQLGALKGRAAPAKVQVVRGARVPLVKASVERGWGVFRAWVGGEEVLLLTHSTSYTGFGCGLEGGGGPLKPARPLPHTSHCPPTREMGGGLGVFA